MLKHSVLKGFVLAGFSIGTIYLRIEIPNHIDAYKTLSQNLIGCPTLSRENCKLSG